MLLASARAASSESSRNLLVSSLCPIHDDALPQEMTEHLQNMALEITTHKNHLQCEDFIRLLKSRNLNDVLRNCNVSIDSALLKYKELKELNSESRKKSTVCNDGDITGDEMLMEGLAIRCHLLLTYAHRNTGINCLLDAMTKILADLQKLQINNMLTLLDNICHQEVSQC